jgi:hypothetical protein
LNRDGAGWFIAGLAGCSGVETGAALAATLRARGVVHALAHTTPVTTTFATQRIELARFMSASLHVEVETWRPLRRGAPFAPTP